MKRLADEAEFLRGARLHESGEHWEAHEAWEGLWREAAGEETRVLLQGLIQVTAAFHKLLVRREGDAALRILDRGLEKLDRVPAAQDGVDVAAFREGARACREALAQGQAAFDPRSIPRVTLCPPERG